MTRTNREVYRISFARQNANAEREEVKSVCGMLGREGLRGDLREAPGRPRAIPPQYPRKSYELPPPAGPPPLQPPLGPPLGQPLGPPLGPPQKSPLGPPLGLPPGPPLGLPLGPPLRPPLGSPLVAVFYVFLSSEALGVSFPVWAKNEAGRAGSGSRQAT